MGIENSFNLEILKENNIIKRNINHNSKSKEKETPNPQNSINIKENKNKILIKNNFNFNLQSTKNKNKKTPNTNETNKDDTKNENQNQNTNSNNNNNSNSKEIQNFEAKIKNNDSPAIIFGYLNILNNLYHKINQIEIRESYENIYNLPEGFFKIINFLLKFFIVILIILINIFLFKCDFFIRFNMYLILINDTKTVIEKGEIKQIIANIKRWFAFISVVILDEIIKFLYIPEILLNIWTCLLTIYLLLISGPESGVQFIIVNIYKILGKMHLFY